MITSRGRNLRPQFLARYFLLIVGFLLFIKFLLVLHDCKGSTRYWNSLKYWEGLTGGRPSVYFPALIGQRDQEPEYSTFPN